MSRFKKLQAGFAATEAILILVIVGLVAFVAWYAFHTKNSTDNTYNNAANTQLNPPQKSTKTSANTKTSATASIIQTKTSSSLGQYLADGSGKTLYTYGKDTSGVSNCTGSCLADWPVYTAASSTNLPANVTVITRSDNTKQYAYKGLPLYYFSGDTSAGMVTGDGVNDFHVAKP
jgi:predicted lipoprotein with Yx(FWY)xxD motif